MGYPTTVDTGTVQPWIITNEEFLSQGSTFTLTANNVYLYLFEIAGPITIATMRYRIGATATGTVDLGLYDSGGNLLSHTGATAVAASNINSLSLLTTVNLSPGRYSMALCPSNSTDTYVGSSGLKNGGGRYALATNTGTAGVLPSTTGTILVSTFSIVVNAVVTGGAP